MKKKICFFAMLHSGSEEALKRIGFYAQDIKILQEIGFSVHCAINPQQIRSADLYYAWFWNWAFAPAIMARLNRKKPLIITGVFNAWHYWTMPVYKRSIVRFAANYARWNLLTSKIEIDHVSSIFPSDRTMYVPLGVDHEYFAPASQSNSTREDIIYSTITMTQSNALRKCVPELIESIPAILLKFPNIKFIFAGICDDIYREKVIKLGISNNVEFPGVISEEEKLKYLRICKIFVQPTRFEGFGLAIAEAMSCGAPVVTSPVGSVPELVADSAVFVDGSSPSNIAEGICSLLEDKKKQQRLSILGRNRIIESFSYDRRKKQLTNLLGPLL